MTKVDVQSSFAFPLHRGVWNNNGAELNELLNSKQYDIEETDYRGNTPLMLAIKLSHADCVNVLLAHGASPTAVGEGGWPCMDEAACIGNTSIFAKLLDALEEESMTTWEAKLPLIAENLKKMPDFYLELEWAVKSWIPGVSHFCPSDTYKIYKKGANIRINTTLIVKAEETKFIRGSRDFIFSCEKNGKLFMLENDLKQYQKMHVERNSVDEVGIIAEEAIKGTCVQYNFDEKLIEFTPVYKFTGGERFDIVGRGGSWVIEKDTATDGTSSSNGSLNGSGSFAPPNSTAIDRTANISEQSPPTKEEPQTWMGWFMGFIPYNNSGNGNGSTSNIKTTPLPETSESSASYNCSTFDSETGRFSCELANGHSSNTHPVVYAGSENGVAGCQNDQWVGESSVRQQARATGWLGKCFELKEMEAVVEERYGAFSHVPAKTRKKLQKEHPVWPPPPVPTTFEEYFNTSSDQAIQTETVRLFPQIISSKTKQNLKGQVWLSKQFPLLLEDLFPLLEVLSPTNKVFKSMKRFLTSTLPTQYGFPVKTVVPIAPTMSAVLLFSFFEQRPEHTIPDSLFSVPPFYTNVDTLTGEEREREHINSMTCANSIHST
eukprot:GCRY01003556.1.p1 GENE.GCRY01003556.1~~GCRY01003556.1.p1  ORF type:complete len:604 (-),score=49.22 GCRY01003556.1:198-2009(-)